ncbi:hypothetical protein BGZ93_011024 [Podila epicladia]|nr:hypothetical protein BGZ93_011024 [Podila epicladia]
MPSLCNVSPKFNTALSSSIIYQPEILSVRYTEGTITAQLVSDVMVLGSNNGIPINNGNIGSIVARESTITWDNTAVEDNNSTAQESNARLHPTWPSDAFRGMRTFGLTSDVSGDAFLLTKETHVTGFLGASKDRFESESALTEKWGTLTLGGSDPAFYSEPLTWLPTIPGEAGWVTRLFAHIEVLVNDGISASYPDMDYVRTDLDRVWFDSGTTYIWGDEAAVLPLNEWMGADPVTGQVDCATIPSLGKIVFSIGGTRADGEPVMRLELTSAEYIIGRPKSHKCFSALNVSSNSKNYWIFGLQVLRSYYTVYHYGYGVIGIARYNITNTNPSGKIVVPGSRAALDRNVKKTLLQLSRGKRPVQGSPMDNILFKQLTQATLKLVFCVDLDHSMEELFFEGTRPTDSRMNRTKSLLKWYINQKSAWSAGHEFAMIILGEKAVWVLEDLRKDNRFYFDCIYIHNKSSDVVGNVKPQHVYDRLTEFEDARSVGYFFELTRLYRKFSSAMAELLANPAFRPIQDEHDFRIPPLPLSQDDEPLVQKVQQRSDSAQSLKGGPASSPAQSSTSRISSPFSTGSPVMTMEQRSSPVRVRAEPATPVPGSSQPGTGGGTGSGGGSVNDAILL